MDALWRNDPIVRLEKALTPIGPLICFAAAEAVMSDRSCAVEKIRNALTHAISEIEAVQTGPMAAMNISLTAKERAVADRLITLLRTLAHDIGHELSPQQARDLLPDFQNDLVPLINETMDTFRARFIDTVIHRQMASDAAAAKAQKEIERISKKIFFVSINASVEATRFGDAGAAFVVISQEIRALSQQAQSSLKRLVSG